MANVGTAASGKTLIGAGNGSSPTYASIGTNSGLTAHGVLIAEGNGAFAATAVGTAGHVLTSNGVGLDPTFQPGAGGGVNTINGDTGSITGSTVRIYANQVGNGCGHTVLFANSGTDSILKFTDGNLNTCLGALCGSGTLVGGSNTGVGYRVLKACTSGAGNTGVGQDAINSTSTGTGNTGVGYTSLIGPSSGSYNTAIGMQSLAINSFNGTRNIGIGYFSGSNYSTTESSNILISNAGVAAESNVMRLGTQGSSAGQVNKAFVAGINGNTLSGTPDVVTIDTTTGQLGVAAFPSGGVSASFDPWIVGPVGDLTSNYTNLQTAINAAQTAGASSTNQINLYLKSGTYGGNTHFIIYDGINLIALKDYPGGCIDAPAPVNADANYGVLISGYIENNSGGTNYYQGLYVQTTNIPLINTIGGGTIYATGCKLVTTYYFSVYVAFGTCFIDNCDIEAAICGIGYITNSTIKGAGLQTACLEVGTYTLSNTTLSGNIGVNGVVTATMYNCYLDNCLCSSVDTLNLTGCTIAGGVTALLNGSGSTIIPIDCNDVTPNGTSGYVLTSTGPNTLATWQAVPAGGSYYSVTPYIVGQTGDTHAQFTGDTGIQDAIDQAVLDGHDATNSANIYIKPGTYTPTANLLTLHDGINLYGFDEGEPNNKITVEIVANVALASAFSAATISGVRFENTGFGTYFLDATSAASTFNISFINCFCNVFTTTALLVPTGLTASIIFSNSFLSCSNVFDTSTVGSVTLGLTYSTLSSGTLSTRSSGTTYLSALWSELGGIFEGTGSASYQINTEFSNFGSIDVSTSSSSLVGATNAINTNFRGPINFDPVLPVVNCTSGGQQLTEQKKITTYNTNSTIVPTDNVIFAYQSGGITLTTPITTIPGWKLTIKDYAGTASTNNITITDAIGRTFDGQSSLVISADFGSVTIVADGGGSSWNII